MNDMRDMAVLADLPELAGDQARPKSEITLFKLGNFRHPRQGNWRISADIFQSFVANFAKQGRVPIDFDHAPEKGGSTEAAGWITSLQVVGGTLRAAVEWTKIGAEAIREKRFLFISPSWAFNARDPQGAELGPRLIGAGLTNRPFFTDLPTLSLAENVESADAIRAEVESFTEHFALAVQHGIGAAHEELYRAHWEKNGHLHGSVDGALMIIESGRALQRKWWGPVKALLAADPGKPGGIMTADDPGRVVFAAPPGLDAEGERLHGEIIVFAREHEHSDYCTAAAALTGISADPPLRYDELPTDISDVDVEDMRKLDQLARAVVIAEDVGYADAGVLVELDERVATAEAENGSSDVEWLDTSRSMRSEPWNEAHFERDKRRASTLGWDLTRDEWLAGAELGEDIVFGEAVKRRADRIADARYGRDRELADAREREAERRKSTIDEELRRRAERRLGRE